MIDRIKSSKLLISLLVLIILLVILLIGRVSYTAIKNNIDEKKDDNTKTPVENNDRLEFVDGEALDLVINSTTLSNENVSNVEKASTYKATLLSRADGTIVNYGYYVYLTISNNNFVYTTPDEKAEILLTVMGPSGEITNLEGLNYKTSGGISGFDITTYNGTIPIAQNYAISSNSATKKTEHPWTFKITYINLPTDQSQNLDKTINTNIKMQKNAI